MNKDEVRKKIEHIGVVPVVRAASAGEARFAAEAVAEGGIPVVEITMTVPGAVSVIAALVREAPDVLVGAGTVLDPETALECLDAGAQFLVSPGFDADVVQLANKQHILIMAGALTPTEVIVAWKAGADLVKIFPCAQVGGASYIKALKGPLPRVPLIPTGGVHLGNIKEFIHAGAAALGVGGELIQKDALQSRQRGVIDQLARQYVEMVQRSRAELHKN
jgi:2-dehydro-3-deoxyphosphogluconate aldolase / (4S)-4-hydroxy-2-oxoglutarate aldolase